MTTAQEAQAALQRLLDQYEGKQTIRHALLGDSNGNVEVSGRPGWAFVRYREDLNRLSTVRYLIQQQYADGMPVVVGKKYPDSPYVEVLGPDWSMYAYSPSASEVAQQATPAIDASDLSPGRVVPTSPASLNVGVQPFLYINGDTAVEFAYDTIDLTADVPGIAGHCLVLVYVDLDTDALDSLQGTIVAVGTDADAPAVPEHALPLGVVDLANAEASIESTDITQYKAMYDGTTTSATGSIGGVAYAQGLIIRGGPAGWQGHDASGDGYALVGDGTDIISDLTPLWKGTHTWTVGDDEGWIITLDAAQSANAYEVKDSGGNVLSGADERGILFSDGNSHSTNVIIGSDAGNTAITTSRDWVIVGDTAASDLNGADYGVAVGSHACENLTTGNFNTAVGNYALHKNETGAANTAVGASALWGGVAEGVSNGAYNAAFGYIAGQSTTSGSYNLSAGARAGWSVTTGSYHTLLGYYAGASLTTEEYNIFIGHRAGYGQRAGSTLLIDSYTRANDATELTHSLLYGTMGTNPEDQQLTVNASALHMGEDNTPAYGAFLTANDVDNGGTTIVANGTGDVTVGMQVLYFVSESGGGTSGGTVTCLNNANVDIYDDGVDTLNLAVAADGSVTLARTAGAATFDCVLLAVWS